MQFLTDWAFMKKPLATITSILVIPALTLSLAVTAAPKTALATDSDVVTAWGQAAASMFDSYDYHSYSSASSADPVPLSSANVSTTGPVSYYSLYDLGLVTPAKTQAPWNQGGCPNTRMLVGP